MADEPKDPPIEVPIPGARPMSPEERAALGPSKGITAADDPERQLRIDQLKAEVQRPLDQLKTKQESERPKRRSIPYSAPVSHSSNPFAPGPPAAPIPAPLDITSATKKPSVVEEAVQEIRSSVQRMEDSGTLERMRRALSGGQSSNRSASMTATTSQRGHAAAGIDDSEKNFAVALAAYGALFGTGLYRLAEHDWWFGGIYAAGGALGLMSVTPLIRSKIGFMRSSRSLWVAVSITWLFLAANIGVSIYDHFSRSQRPFTIGVSPISGPAVAPAPPAPDIPRIYTKKTVADFAALCASRTALQCDEFMADEKGKWIETDGKIQTIWGNGENTGMLLFNDVHPVQCEFGKKWRDRLNTFHPFELIKIAGKLGPNQPGPLIYLQECELRD